MKRSCGILLPVSSLPSPYGIGTLGKAAYDFVDFLAEAGQSWWQVLPVGHTSYGDSPYQCFSTYAGNPYYVDLDLLVEDGLLEQEELTAVKWGEDPANVDYETIYNNRFSVLRLATERGWKRDAAEISAFLKKNRHWLPDYSLFMALKAHFGMRAWTEWEEEGVRLRRPEALARYRVLLDADIRMYTYIQFLFFRQWEKLRAYAAKLGIGIIGDIPIYVAMDSADVWANPDSFQLDEKNLPTAVAGVPPDYFSEDGQLWGNPLYDWDIMKQNGYKWWIQRIEGAANLFDVIRIDHFRGFESYWAVPYGEKTARNGKWIKGPGMDLVGTLTSWFPNVRFIAEDLGLLTPEVAQLLKESGLPGMKVLEFAFSPDASSGYLPHNHIPNCVCYPGTHDNTTLVAWEDEATQEEVTTAKAYLGIGKVDDLYWGILRGGLSSVANLFVAQMQDYLGLGAEARMNTPGVLGGNWQWRLTQKQLTPQLAAKLAGTAKLYGRAPVK